MRTHSSELLIRTLKAAKTVEHDGDGGAARATYKKGEEMSKGTLGFLHARVEDPMRGGERGCFILADVRRRSAFITSTLPQFSIQILSDCIAAEMSIRELKY